MDEVWKDMSLSTATPAAGLYPLRLQRHHPPSPSANIVVLQDFLASAPVPQPPTPPPPPPLPLPLPPTALSLSSTLEFTYLSAGAGAGPPSNSSSGDDSRGDFMPDSYAGARTDIFSFAARKHGAAADPPQCPGAGAGGDRRHRRMIKNRESAARSRARKQAYTNELELALAQLRRENEMLVKRQEVLNVRQRTAMAAQVPDRPSVQRCRSAPP